MTSGGPFQSPTAVKMLFVGQINKYIMSLFQEGVLLGGAIKLQRSLVNCVNCGFCFMGLPPILFSLALDFYFSTQLLKLSSRK